MISIDQVKIITGRETEEIKQKLSSYDDKISKLLEERGLLKTYDYTSRNGPAQECDYHPADRFHGIYLAMLPFLSQNSGKIIQVAGGWSPLLHAIKEFYPETQGRLVALDKCSYFSSGLGAEKGIDYVCESAGNLHTLGLQDPAIVFSYHFLDFAFHTFPLPIGSSELTRIQRLVQGEGIYAYSGAQNLRDLVESMIDALPQGSVIISQTMKTKEHYPELGNRHVTIQEILEFMKDVGNNNGVLYRIMRELGLNLTLQITTGLEYPDEVQTLVMIGRKPNRTMLETRKKCISK